jgi:hypothetical protein
VNLKKFVTIGLVLGILANVLDIVLHGFLLAGLYQAYPVFRTESPIPLFILGDFVAAFVFTWVYLRWGPGPAAGAAGGAVFGFYAGVLVNFPTNIFLHLTIRGIPYFMAWVWTACGILWYVVLGAVAGAMNRR